MKPIACIAALLLLSTFTLSAEATTDLSDPLNIKCLPFIPDNNFVTLGWYNWGGSIIQGDDGKYHLFYSRWPIESTFLGWLTQSEIAVATSVNPTGLRDSILYGLKNRLRFFP